MRLYLLALVPVALAQTTTSTTGSGTATAAAPASTGSSITVGVGPGLVFNPNTITANPGDTVVFQFLPQNHSVVQGDYSKPCQPAANAFYSGFLPVISGHANVTFNVLINDTNPIWVYCSQITHCQSGMEMVINPPPASSGGQTLQAYQDGSAKASILNPPAIAGGVFAQDNSGSGTGGAAGSASAAVSSAVASVASSVSSVASSVASSVSSAASTVASSTGPTPAVSSAAAPGGYHDLSAMGVTGFAAMVFGGLLL